MEGNFYKGHFPYVEVLVDGDFYDKELRSKAYGLALESIPSKSNLAGVHYDQLASYNQGDTNIFVFTIGWKRT